MDADQQRRMELRDERVREWQTRRRGPGDLTTWAVVLGGVMAVFLFFSAAYDGNVGFGGIMLVAIIAWTIVLSVPGGINVPSILWGRSVDPNLPFERVRIVLLASAALALLAVFLPILDLASTLDFGWYGLIAGAIGGIYLIVLARSRPGLLR